MAEYEIGIMDRQAIKGRIPSQKKLIAQINAWQQTRNAKITWKFTKEKARDIFKYQPAELS